MASASGAKQPLEHARMMGTLVEVDTRAAKALPDADLASEIAVYEAHFATEDYHGFLAKLEGARKTSLARLQELRIERDRRQARTDAQAGALTLEEVLAMKEVPDGIRLDALPWQDRDTGRGLSVQIVGDDIQHSMDGTTLGQLRQAAAANKPRRGGSRSPYAIVDVAWEATGRSLPFETRVDRVRISRRRMAEMIAARRTASRAP